MTRKSTLKNLKKERKQPKSEIEVSSKDDSDTEVSYRDIPIKNSNKAIPIINSAGIVAYKVTDVKV
jgi:hypothetical protein